jgi:hypothetical protein
MIFLFMLAYSFPSTYAAIPIILEYCSYLYDTMLKH